MSSQKKVIVRQLDDTLLWGYLPATGILDGDDLPVLDTTGRVQPIRLSLIKTVAYVKDFNLNDNADPERLGRRSFAGRPRANGLWLKLEFTDGDTIEGLAQFEFGFIDSLIEDRSVAVIPPDPKSNVYRLLVPRAAIANLEILGLITPPTKKKPPTSSPTLQGGLFNDT